MVVPWRNRARRAVETRLRDGLRTTNGDARPHYIVCGNDALAYHLVNALGPATVRVTVVVPPRPHPTAPDITKIRGKMNMKAKGPAEGDDTPWWKAIWEDEGKKR